METHNPEEPKKDGIPTHAEHTRTSESLLRQLSETLRDCFASCSDHFNAFTERLTKSSKDEANGHRILLRRMDALTSELSNTARRLDALTKLLNERGSKPG